MLPYAYSGLLVCGLWASFIIMTVLCICRSSNTGKLRKDVDFMAPEPRWSTDAVDLLNFVDDDCIR